VFPSYEPTFEYFAREIARGERLAVVNLDECSASNFMCERYQLPLCRMVLAPSRFDSLARPAWPFHERPIWPFSVMLERGLKRIYQRKDLAPPLLRRMNQFRAPLGLPPLTRVAQINAWVQRQICCFPDWFGLPQPDWPGNVELVGFLLPESRAALPAELAAFLARAGKPLVFTPGTGVVDVDGFFADALSCCEQLQRPGVFLSPHYRGPARQPAMPVFHAPFVELQPLLAQSALLVHHGGAGTTARALQAGIPQIIRAMAYDQPDNGTRIQQLGVGRFFAPDGFSLARLVTYARQLLDSAQVQARLQDLSQEIAGTSAIGAAADCVEHTLRGEPRNPPRHAAPAPERAALPGGLHPALQL
jgi:UDP:flavonoid glycosyltransferase YjiC (YdhE family)